MAVGLYAETPQGLTLHVVERQGCPLHVWTGGPPGRPLVTLLHGATMDHRMFNAQVTALLPEYRVLVWDARGHGRSRPAGAPFSLELCADDLLAALDYLGEDRAVLGGQSLGAMIAQHAYFRQPQRVLALVVIDSVSIAMPYTKLEVWALRASLPLFDLWPYNHFVRTVVNNTALRPEARAYADGAIRSLSREEFLAIWKGVSVAVDDKGMPGHFIEVPMLLTHGDRDRTGSVRKQAPTWAAREPDVTYVVIPDAAHNANQDNPPFFNRVLLDFLRQRVPA